MLGRLKWFFVAFVVLATAAAGLFLGKSKEGEYLNSLYARRDFTLLDDSGDFFTLSSLPEKTLLLLVFTPDGIPVDSVGPLHVFSRHLGDLKGMGIETMLISRTNRDIVQNFKRAAGFPGRLLLDTGGTVGRIAGVWEGIEPASYWGYALVNQRFETLWLAKHNTPLSFTELKKALNEAR